MFLLEALGFLTLISLSFGSDFKCVLQLKDASFREDLDVLLSSGAKMIEYDITIENVDLEQKGGRFYRWNHWVRTVDNRGKSLLMLEEHYELLSLNTMKIGVKQLSLELIAEPNGCIGNLSVDETVNLLRSTLLADFKFSENGTLIPVQNSNRHVCNMYAKDDNGKATFLYECCFYNDLLQLVCSDINKDVWMSVLLVFVIIVKVILILFCPLLIPGKLYREKYTEAEYHYHIRDGNNPKIRVVATKNPESYSSSNNVVKLNKLSKMEKFGAMLRTMTTDKIHEIELNDILLSVSTRRLLKENVVPVGIFRYFYDKICLCKVRKTDAFAPCCYSNIFGKLEYGFKDIAWYKCLLRFMKLIQLLLIIVPWILRMVIYFNYEQETEVRKLEKSEQLDLSLFFTGSLTLYLTPLHGLFILCYVILVIDSMAYCFISHNVKEKLKFVSMSSLRDMREKNKLNVCKWAIELALSPCTAYGFIGLLVLVPFWVLLSPFFLLLFIFYFFPTINFSVRMIIQFCILICPKRLGDKIKMMVSKTKSVNNRLDFKKITKEEKFKTKGDFNSIKDLIFQYIVIVICFISFWSIIVLIVECLSFFVEIAAYTCIGIIINAQSAIKYLSIISLLVLYSKECFGGLYKKYLNFHQVIVGQLLEKEKSNIEDIARSETEDQENTVFRVKPEMCTLPDVELVVREGEVKWRTSGFLVFLDKNDKPLFPEKFFFQVIEMKYHGSPQSLHYNMFRTFVEFSKMILFLVFIVIVVMAFGDVYSISSTNQMIAAGAGGLLPFIVRHFKSKPVETFNVNSVQFQAEFSRFLSEFQQHWPVSDIFPKLYREIEETSTVPDTYEHILVGNLHDPNNFLDKGTSPEDSNKLNNNEGMTVDLVVDVTDSNDKVRAFLANEATNGSLSMLAESYRETEDV